MFTNLLQKMFLGKDARDLDNLIYQAAKGPVKNQEIGSLAIKIRAGIGDNLGHNNENAPGGGHCMWIRSVK